MPSGLALFMMGLSAGPMRLPLCEMSSAHQAALRAMLEEAGLPGDISLSAGAKSGVALPAIDRGQGVGGVHGLQQQLGGAAGGVGFLRRFLWTHRKSSTILRTRKRKPR